MPCCRLVKNSQAARISAQFLTCPSFNQISPLLISGYSPASNLKLQCVAGLSTHASKIRFIERAQAEEIARWSPRGTYKSVESASPSIFRCPSADWTIRRLNGFHLKKYNGKPCSATLLMEVVFVRALHCLVPMTLLARLFVLRVLRELTLADCCFEALVALTTIEGSGLGLAEAQYC